MEIVSGYSRKCKDSIAGIDKIWLMKYNSYPRSLIVVDGNELVSFPETFIFEFESSQNPSLNETMQENEGGKFYDTSISLSFRSSEIKELELLQQIDVRMLVLDNNGIYRVYGLYNGLQARNITYNTGGAKTDFNGFKIDLTGMEEYESFFVTDPFNIGFIEEGFNYYKDFIMYG